LFNDKGGDSDKKAHPFVSTFGWMYSAKSVADFLNITVHEAYDLNVLEALNILSCLKGLNEYHEFLSK
jgi:hypothetical protein